MWWSQVLPTVRGTQGKCTRIHLAVCAQNLEVRHRPIISGGRRQGNSIGFYLLELPPSLTLSKIGVYCGGCSLTVLSTLILLCFLGAEGGAGRDIKDACN